jgi:hypothetical protein
MGLWKIDQFSQNVSHKVTLKPSNSTPTSIPKRNKNMHPHKTVYTDVHSSTIYNIPKMEQHTCPSTEE